VQAWARNAGLDWVETSIVTRLLFWRSTADVQEAIDGIRHLIASTQPETLILQRNPDMELKLRAQFEERPGTPADGGQHESLFPWFLTKFYVDEQIHSDRWTLMEPFYRVIGTDRNWILETIVTTRNLPRELARCYTLKLLESSETWVIAIDKVPPSLRDHYPTMRRELNAMEHRGLPEWQRDLYWQPPSNDGKYVLKNPAWTGE
jgi:hypothetical protein